MDLAFDTEDGDSFEGRKSRRVLVGLEGWLVGRKIIVVCMVFLVRGFLGWVLPDRSIEGRGGKGR